MVGAGMEGLGHLPVNQPLTLPLTPPQSQHHSHHQKAVSSCWRSFCFFLSWWSFWTLLGSPGLLLMLNFAHLWKTSLKFLVLTLLCLITYCTFGMHGWTPLYIPRGRHRAMAAVPPGGGLAAALLPSQCWTMALAPSRGRNPMAVNMSPTSGQFLLAMSQVPSGGGIFKCDQPMKLFNFSPKLSDGT